MSLIPINEIAISLPFKVDSFGTISATVDQGKIWQDRARSVVGTAVGERVYRPKYGCEAANKMYESEELLLSTIEEDVRTSFQQFLPLLSLSSVEVSLQEETRTINVEISYATPSSAEYLIKIGIATIDGLSPIQEEIAWQLQ
jgi:phage baseplate assembly protein W